jgi:hypothetical protein
MGTWAYMQVRWAKENTPTAVVGSYTMGLEIGGAVKSGKGLVEGLHCETNDLLATNSESK